MNYQILTVYDYAEDPEEDQRVTISPQEIEAVFVKTKEIQRNGRTLVSVCVGMASGNMIALTLNHSDLALLENVAGRYSFEE